MSIRRLTKASTQTVRGMAGRVGTIELLLTILRAGKYLLACKNVRQRLPGSNLGAVRRTVRAVRRHHGGGAAGTVKAQAYERHCRPPAGDLGPGGDGARPRRARDQPGSRDPGPGRA